LLLLLIMILGSATSLIGLKPAQSSLVVTLHQFKQTTPSPAPACAPS